MFVATCSASEALAVMTDRTAKDAELSLTQSQRTYNSGILGFSGDYRAVFKGF